MPDQHTCSKCDKRSQLITSQFPRGWVIVDGAKFCQACNPNAISVCASCGARKQNVSRDRPRGWVDKDGALSCTKCRTLKKYSGSGGKVKVGRLRFACPCGETFSLLFSPRILCRAVCPRCKRVALELFADARLEDFTLKVRPWKIECVSSARS